MVKFTLKEIKEIIKDTPKEFKGVAKNQYHNHFIGMYYPKGANWAYMVYMVLKNGVMFQVVTQFGQIQTD